MSEHWILKTDEWKIEGHTGEGMCCRDVRTVLPIAEMSGSRGTVVVGV